MYFADNKEDCDMFRYQGLQKALTENKLEVNEDFYYLVHIEKKEREKDYEKLLDYIQKKDITAVFAASDQYAIELMRFLLRKGVKVPEEISIVGFDDIPLAAQIYPGLTTISQNIPLRGKMAVEMLQDQIEDNATGGSVLLPAQLIARESVKKIN